jgi:N-acyl amino acid synthase of PEP-CTERM/exosortase system
MTILDAFNYYFEMIPADSDELKQEVFKLRYQVYCLERSFLDIPPDGMEHDQDDERSCHYLIRHRESGSYMATTRLILADAHHPDNLLPVEAHSKIDNTDFTQTIPRASLAELSRFCVSKQFRRRANEQDLIVTNDLDERRSSYGNTSSASITLALFACAIRMSSEHNIHYWFALMEPALKRVVAPLGINVMEIGGLVDYHGMRMPCAVKVDDLLESVRIKDMEYWTMLTNDGEFTV